MRKTFAYYYTNYAMVMLPSRTSGNKIRHTAEEWVKNAAD